MQLSLSARRIAATHLMPSPNTVARSIRVLVLAEPLVAWGLERLVQTVQPRMEVAGTCQHLADALAYLQRNPSDVALVDLDVDVGVEGISQLFAASRARILAISGSRDPALHDAAVLAGARGVLHKGDSPALLLKAIDKVHDGELWVDRAATSRIFMELARQKAARDRSPEQQKIAALTRRERQSIAVLVSDAEAPTRVIAARLHISEHTLRNHLTSIYSKLAVPSRVALHAYAHRHGLTEGA
jgi:DNA-binding NarL/FixJ family response regulator